tara:strand:- start:860 stop:1237 length:378 start_codon:yes stop_codon:yes gene_type:complete
MGVLDPDEGKIGTRVYQDPFLRPGFKPESARPDFDSLPPDYDPMKPELLPHTPKPRPRPKPGVGSGGVVTIDQIVADTQEPELEQQQQQQQQQDDSKPSDFSLTDDQKYMLIGLAVIGAFLGFLK